MFEEPGWFDGMIPNFESFLKDFKDKPDLNFLQIGVFSGAASKWLLDNILTNTSSQLIDVDPWFGSQDIDFNSIANQSNIRPGKDSFTEEELVEALIWQGNEIEHMYDKKMLPYKNVKKIKTISNIFFKDNDIMFDFIYVDGEHYQKEVYEDANNALRFVKVNGIIAFDDYEWHDISGLEEKRPGPAIDRFIYENKDSIEVIHRGYQLWVKRIK